jgi:hypothetical protein
MIPLIGRAVIFRRCHMRLRTWLLAPVALVAAAFLVLAVACGGDEEESPKASPTTAAEKTPTAGETPEKTPAGEAGELPSIPAYPGAEGVFSGAFDTGGGFPFPLSEDIPIDPEEFGSAQYTAYKTSDSSGKVVDFYEKELKGWKEEGSFSTEQVGLNGEVVVWSKDNRNVAAWMGVFEEEGETSVVIVMGARQQ